MSGDTSRDWPWRKKYCGTGDINGKKPIITNINGVETIVSPGCHYVYDDQKQPVYVDSEWQNVEVEDRNGVTVSIPAKVQKVHCVCNPQRNYVLYDTFVKTLKKVSIDSRGKCKPHLLP